MDAELNLQQKACYFGERLLSARTALHAGISAGFGEMRGSPQVPEDGMADFGRRFEVFYSRTAAQRAGELLGGLVSHEDPRPHLSKEEHFWGRTRSALLSAMVTQGSDGVARPALGPLAGAFGSGFVGMACYRRHDSWGDGFRFAGVAYSGYFTSALEREFHPELSAFAARVLHRRKQD